MTAEAPQAPARWRYAIPSAFTLGTALCGFAAVAGIAGEPGVWILGAWACDMADGLVARMTGTQSAFGAQLDSLCDAIGFGVAPAYLVGQVGSAAGLGISAWVCAAFYLATVLIRLARFNLGDGGSDAGGHLYFEGLPSPAAGVSIAALVLTGSAFAGAHGLPVDWLGAAAPAVAPAIGLALPVVAIALGALMVSRFRYADLPKHYLRGLQPRWHLAALAVAAFFLGYAPVLALFFAYYVVVSPLVGRQAAPEGPHL